MNWARLLIAPPDPPLGFKRATGEGSALALAFSQTYPRLPIVVRANELGNAGELIPNIADAGNKLSLYVSFFLLNELFAEAGSAAPLLVDAVDDAQDDSLPLAIIGSGQSLGAKLENKLALGLRDIADDLGLAVLVASRGNAATGVATSFRLTDYWPYSAAPTSREDPNADELYRRLGRGHLIQPDVVVWRRAQKRFGKVDADAVVYGDYETRELVACISGKATIRSDRSQSSRYEGSTISRWRRGRAPHFCVVTAEPTPQRLGSLAWGLGEIDAVYHASLAGLVTGLQGAIAAINPDSHAQELAELTALIDTARLRDLSMLGEDIFSEMTVG